jgi:hypothetical protein
VFDHTLEDKRLNLVTSSGEAEADTGGATACSPSLPDTHLHQRLLLPLGPVSQRIPSAHPPTRRQPSSSPSQVKRATVSTVSRLATVSPSSPCVGARGQTARPRLCRALSGALDVRKTVIAAGSSGSSDCSSGCAYAAG